MSGALTSKLPPEVEEKYRIFLVSLINNDLDLTRLVKADLVAQISITPVVINEMKKFDSNEYLASALFAVKVDKNIVSNEKHIEIKKGYIRIAYGKIYIEIYGMTLEIDDQKLAKVRQ